MKINELKVKQVVHIDEKLEEGVLYVSKRFQVCIHLCACGCGAQTVTPVQSHTDWEMSGTDEVVTLRPSILNPQPFCPNGAHYYVTDNKIEWLP